MRNIQTDSGEFTATDQNVRLKTQGQVHSIMLHQITAIQVHQKNEYAWLMIAFSCLIGSAYLNAEIALIYGAILAAVCVLIYYYTRKKEVIISSASSSIIFTMKNKDDEASTELIDELENRILTFKNITPERSSHNPKPGEGW